MPPISEPAAAAWRAYREAYDAGLPRARVRAAMEAFLAALTPGDRAPFARWFLREVFDHDAGLADPGSFVRLASEAVLVPELVAGAREGRADHLRWMALATVHFRLDVRDLVPELDEPWRRQGLMALALARNPGSPQLWRMLVRREIGYLDDVGHEMGDGFLLADDAECRAALRSARHLVERAPAGGVTAYDRDELAYLEACYAAFFAWRAAGRPGRFARPASSRF